jgi:hypothetical protein
MLVVMNEVVKSADKLEFVDCACENATRSEKTFRHANEERDSTDQQLYEQRGDTYI